jgi:hypothetical protein
LVSIWEKIKVAFNKVTTFLTNLILGLKNQIKRLAGKAEKLFDTLTKSTDSNVEKKVSLSVVSLERAQPEQPAVINLRVLDALDADKEPSVLVESFKKLTKDIHIQTQDEYKLLTVIANNIKSIDITDDETLQVTLDKFYKALPGHQVTARLVPKKRINQYISKGVTRDTLPGGMVIEYDMMTPSVIMPKDRRWHVSTDAMCLVSGKLVQKEGYIAGNNTIVTYAVNSNWNGKARSAVSNIRSFIEGVGKSLSTGALSTAKILMDDLEKLCSKEANHLSAESKGDLLDLLKLVRKVSLNACALSTRVDLYLVAGCNDVLNLISTTHKEAFN